MTEVIKAGQFSANMSHNIGDDSMLTETDIDISMDDFRSAPIVQPARIAPLPIQCAATDSVVYTGPLFRSPVDEVPALALPTKDTIRTREQLILEKQRQAQEEGSGGVGGLLYTSSLNVNATEHWSPEPEA
jgi:hypothetical protein